MRERSRGAHFFFSTPDFAPPAHQRTALCGVAKKSKCIEYLASMDQWCTNYCMDSMPKMECGTALVSSPREGAWLFPNKQIPPLKICKLTILPFDLPSI